MDEAVEKKEFENFTFNNRQEIEKFENFLEQYITKKAQVYPSHISLVNAYDLLQTRKDGGRIFMALFDLQLTFMLLSCDMHNVLATWNKNFSKGKLEGGTILDSRDKFFGKMEMHRFNSSFVLRYRALWDKIMGFLVLYFKPDEYDKFYKGPSRKKRFKKIAKEIPIITDGFINDIEEIITKFDNMFRTSEAHGSGVLRKWSFTMDLMIDNPLSELVSHDGIANQIMIKIGKLFRS